MKSGKKTDTVAGTAAVEAEHRHKMKLVEPVDTDNSVEDSG